MSDSGQSAPDNEGEVINAPDSSHTPAEQLQGEPENEVGADFQLGEVDDERNSEGDQDGDRIGQNSEHSTEEREDPNPPETKQPIAMFGFGARPNDEQQEQIDIIQEDNVTQSSLNELASAERVVPRRDDQMQNITGTSEISVPSNEIRSGLKTGNELGNRAGNTDKMSENQWEMCVSVIESNTEQGISKLPISVNTAIILCDADKPKDIEFNIVCGINYEGAVIVRRLSQLQRLVEAVRVSSDNMCVIPHFPLPLRSQTYRDLTPYKGLTPVNYEALKLISYFFTFILSHKSILKSAELRNFFTMTSEEYDIAIGKKFEIRNKSIQLKSKSVMSKTKENYLKTAIKLRSTAHKIKAKFKGKGHEKGKDKAKDTEGKKSAKDEAEVDNGLGDTPGQQQVDQRDQQLAEEAPQTDTDISESSHKFEDVNVAKMFLNKGHYDSLQTTLGVQVRTILESITEIEKNMSELISLRSGTGFMTQELAKCLYTLNETTGTLISSNRTLEPIKDVGVYGICSPNNNQYDSGVNNNNNNSNRIVEGEGGAKVDTNTIINKDIDVIVYEATKPQGSKLIGGSMPIDGDLDESSSSEGDGTEAIKTTFGNNQHDGDIVSSRVEASSANEMAVDDNSITSSKPFFSKEQLDKFFSDVALYGSTTYKLYTKAIKALVYEGSLSDCQYEFNQIFFLTRLQFVQEILSQISDVFEIRELVLKKKLRYEYRVARREIHVSDEGKSRLRGAFFKVRGTDIQRLEKAKTKHNECLSELKEMTDVLKMNVEHAMGFVRVVMHEMIDFVIKMKSSEAEKKLGYWKGERR